MISKALYSSLFQDWGTPVRLFDVLNRQYGYTIDAFASKENHKVRRYYTVEQNALTKSFANEIAFGNPPYGATEYPCDPKVTGKACDKKKCRERGYHADVFIPGIFEFVAKAVSVTHGLNPKPLSVPDECGMSLASYPGAKEFHFLIHIRSDTAWWQTLVEPWADEFRTIKGRVNFDPPKGKKATANAPFPSVLVIFKAGKRRHIWGKPIYWKGGE